MMNELQTVWDEFLERWPAERISSMTLEEYVSTKDKSTFTYWVETQTGSIANIKGSPSPKFGIYKRQSEPKERSGMTHGENYSWWDKFGKTESEAFNNVRNEIVKVIRAAQIGDLQVIDNVPLAPVFKWKIAFLYQDQIRPKIINIFAKDKLQILTSLSKAASYPELYQQLSGGYRKEIFSNMAEYGKHCWLQLELVSDDGIDDQTDPDLLASIIPPLNQILYGPPGTGKTYNTVNEALAIVDPEYLAEFGHDRFKIKTRFDELVAKNRIGFVTFHQSFSYEDFVEGLKATSNEAGQINYVIEDGIFKSICMGAIGNKLNLESAINPQGSVWNISIEESGDRSLRAHCFENDIGLLPWRCTGDFIVAEVERNETYYGQGTENLKSLYDFSHSTSLGDLVVCIDSNTSIVAVGVVTGGYSFDDSGITARAGYSHLLPIKWFIKGFSVDFNELKDGRQSEPLTFYPLKHLSAGDVLAHLKSHGVALNRSKSLAKDDKEQKYVLIIDEINRGNISSIFGELITLIEPSKRAGGTEALSVKLPYSKEPFSVPSNLHIIGTMNTADKSLAQVDIALRRRFEFVEMMPDSSVLKKVPPVDGINIVEMLETINQRIELLYDREHTIGHSFFLPLESDPTIERLARIFELEILPLLEEYFFEDWERVGQVLGDHLKKATPELRFIEEKLSGNAISNLMGSDWSQDGISPYQRNKAALLNPEAYKGIYGSQQG